jgi:arylsulfatase A
MMTRRSLLAAPALLSAQAKQPDIVIVLTDDLGYGDLSCFGHPNIKTPQLDKFATQGIRFTDCYAAAPVCSPSRCGLLTGRTPTRLGVYDWIPEKSPMHLQRSEQTFAKLLQQSGYATAHIGKWHCNGLFNNPAQPQPNDHGFDHWVATQNNSLPSHKDPVNFVRNGQPVGPLSGFSSQIVADESIAWLKTVPAAKPICLFACFHSPHEKVATSDAFTAQYGEASPRERAEYFGNVAEMDHHFGRLMAALEAQGRGDALVFFSSDNGPETLLRYPAANRSYGTPGPLRGMKLSLYEGGIRVPGILRWPGRAKAGVTSAEPISGVDILPTLLEAARGPKPANPLDGASLLPALKGKAIRRSVPLHWHYLNAMHEPKAALRDGPWKLVGMWPEGAPKLPVSGYRPEFLDVARKQTLSRFALYHLPTDIAEKKELSMQSPKQFAKLRDRLTTLHREVLTA